MERTEHPRLFGLTVTAILTAGNRQLRNLGSWRTFCDLSESTIHINGRSTATAGLLHVKFNRRLSIAKQRVAKDGFLNHVVSSVHDFTVNLNRRLLTNDTNTGKKTE
jgi:hypothetical protein